MWKPTNIFWGVNSDNLRWFPPSADELAVVFSCVSAAGMFTSTSVTQQSRTERKRWFLSCKKQSVCGVRDGFEIWSDKLWDDCRNDWVQHWANIWPHRHWGNTSGTTFIIDCQILYCGGIILIFKNSEVFCYAFFQLASIPIFGCLRKLITFLNII